MDNPMISFEFRTLGPRCLKGCGLEFIYERSYQNGRSYLVGYCPVCEASLINKYEHYAISNAMKYGALIAPIIPRISESHE